MTIDDISRPAGHSVEFWRGALHDMIDEVLDRILEGAGDLPDHLADDRPDDELSDDGWTDEEDEEPPRSRPSMEEIAEAGTRLRASFGAALDQGTRFWGCDGTLRWTRAWADRFGVLPDRFADNYRRSGARCDCEVLRRVLGRTDVRPRCPLHPAPENR